LTACTHEPEPNGFMSSFPIESDILTPDPSRRIEHLVQPAPNRSALLIGYLWNYTGRLLPVNSIFSSKKGEMFQLTRGFCPIAAVVCLQHRTEK
jgi:hypothetical protein